MQRLKMSIRYEKIRLLRWSDYDLWSLLRLRLIKIY